MSISTFGSLNRTLTGLRAAQLALDTTGQNISNADTEGYTRQEAMFRAIPSLPPGLSGGERQPGMGVDLVTYRRVRDDFVDRQLYDQLPHEGESDGLVSAYEQIELSFPEPSDSGLRSLMDRFFGSWLELSSQPTALAARQSVVEKGKILAQALRDTSNQLQTIATQAGDELTQRIADVNDIGRQVAQLSQMIFEANHVNDPANNLRDQRDLLLDKLASLGNVSITKQPDGNIDVQIGGFQLVNGRTAAALTAESDMPSLTTGRMYALQQVRDVITPAYQTKLNAIAGGLISAVNAQHTSGFDQYGAAGGVFFTGTDAATIDVAAAVVADPKLLAASGTGAPGNSGNAIVLAGLADQAGVVGPDSVNESFRALISDLGNKSGEAQRMGKLQHQSADMLRNRRDSTSSVSLDEEMANLVRFQHSYQASARSLTTMDEVLETLILRTGKVGL